MELNNCNLTYIPYEIANLKSLKRISLQYNFIQEIPWNLYYNQQLVSLNLAHNQIKMLDEDIRLLQNLHELNLSYNTFLEKDSWCDKISSLSGLQIMDCSGASSLPVEWQLPAGLHTLIVNNSSAKFPDRTSGYDSLVNLSIENYEQGDFEKVFRIFNTNHLSTLNVSGNFIKNIPDALTECTRLRALQIKCNSLNSISGNLNLLGSLQSVHAIITDTIALTAFIKALGNAKALTELNLPGNYFTRLPEEINSLKTLEKLDVQNTGLQYLGQGLFQNQLLNEIDLRGNTINKESLVALLEHLPKTTVFYDQVNPLVEPYIKKPFPQITLTPEVFSCNPKKDTVIITKNGTQINIPANSIVDKNNNPLKERVQLSFTTYYDPLDVFLSGIPMNSDSAGVQRNFASAGMFTLTAKTASNKAAFINKNKPVIVNFVSTSPNQSFNYYRLDTVRRDWVQTGKDNVAQGADLKRKFTKNYPAMPLNPYKIHSAKIEITFQKRASSRKSIVFSLRINAAEIEARKQKKDSSVFYDPEEVNAFKNKWVYVGDNLKTYQDLVENGKSAYFLPHTYNKNKKEFYAVSKENIEINIRADYNKDCFIITFYNGNDSTSIEAIPNISNKNPVKEQNEVRDMYRKYEERKKSLTGDRKIRYQKFIKDYRDYSIRMQNYSKLMAAYNNKNVSAEAYQKLFEQVQKNDLDSLLNNAPTLSSITRSLELTGFGTYNCDYFFRVKDPISSSPQFVDIKTNMRIRVKNVTLIDLDENSYIQTTPEVIKLAKNHNYWMFTQTGDLQTGFAEIAAANKPFNKIPVKEVKANSIAELRKQLKY